MSYNNHFKIIVAGYNCVQFAQRCFDSIATQTYTNYDVCVVDDASTDDTARLVSENTEAYGWKSLLRIQNAGALRSQHEGITLLAPVDGDVIVWVDMDDAFSSEHSLDNLNSHYDDATLMTYGNYQPVPYVDTCPTPSRYPQKCEDRNDYRNMLKWGIQYNHLRTVKWDLYKHLTFERDFSYNGEWMNLASDAAVMIPCLEMAGGRYRFISDVLYNYTSDNPISEWRKAPTGTDNMHAAMMTAEKRTPI